MNIENSYSIEQANGNVLYETNDYESAKKVFDLYCQIVDITGKSVYFFKNNLYVELIELYKGGKSHAN